MVWCFVVCFCCFHAWFLPFWSSELGFWKSILHLAADLHPFSSRSSPRPPLLGVRAPSSFHEANVGGYLVLHEDVAWLSSSAESSAHPLAEVLFPLTGRILAERASCRKTEPTTGHIKSRRVSDDSPRGTRPTIRRNAVVSRRSTRQSTRRRFFHVTDVPKDRVTTRIPRDHTRMPI